MPAPRRSHPRHGRRRRAATAVVTAMLSLLGACGGGPSFDGSVLRKAHTAYRVGPLSGFERVDAGDNDLAFSRPGMGVIGVHATCGDYDDVPPQALAGHLLFGTTHRRYLIDEEAQVDGRQARHMLVDAMLDGAPVELEVYVLVKNGCVYDLTHARAGNPQPAARQTFDAFVAAFAVLKP